MQHYGKIDILVYNSGAVWWSSVEKTPMKRFMLMQQVNPQGLYGTIQACMPHWQSNGWYVFLIRVRGYPNAAIHGGRASRLRLVAGKHALLSYLHLYTHASFAARRRMPWVRWV